MITIHIPPSIIIKVPLTIKEYKYVDISLGAKLPKNITPEIKWHINRQNITTIVPNIFLFLK